MKVTVYENKERPDELIDVAISMDDDEMRFTYPVCLLNLDDNGQVTLELGVDEVRYLD